MMILSQGKIFAKFYEGNYLFSKDNSPALRNVTDFMYIHVLFKRITNNVHVDVHYLSRYKSPAALDMLFSVPSVR